MKKKKHKCDMFLTYIKFKDQTLRTRCFDCRKIKYKTRLPIIQFKVLLEKYFEKGTVHEEKIKKK